MNKAWQTRQLGEVCEIVKGRKPILKATASAGDLPYLVARVMRGSAEPQYASVRDANAVTVEESETIIICDGSNSGEVFSGFRGILSSTMGKIAKTAEVDDNFLRAFLVSRYDLFNRAKTGAAIPHLDKEAMYEMECPLPPLPEQRRIARLLGEAFADIARARSNVESNRQKSRILSESHLHSVFTQRGKGWKQKTLEEIAITFGRGKSKHRPRNAPHLYGGNYPFVQTGDIRNADHTITEYSQTYSEAGLAQSKLWPKGTICITIAANIAETAILGFDACFPDSVIGVVVNPKEAESSFIEYLLQSFKTRIQSMGKGSAQHNINMGTFEQQRFPLPPVAEQRQIVATLDKLRAETQRLAMLYELKLRALETLRKSLLHSAFSGKL